METIIQEIAEVIREEFSEELEKKFLLKQEIYLNS